MSRRATTSYYPGKTGVGISPYGLLPVPFLPTNMSTVSGDFPHFYAHWVDPWIVSVTGVVNVGGLSSIAITGTIPPVTIANPVYAVALTGTIPNLNATIINTVPITGLVNANLINSIPQGYNIIGQVGLTGVPLVNVQNPVTAVALTGTILVDQNSIWMVSVTGPVYSQQYNGWAVAVTGTVPPITVANPITAVALTGTIPNINTTVLNTVPVTGIVDARQNGAWSVAVNNFPADVFAVAITGSLPPLNTGYNIIGQVGLTGTPLVNVNSLPVVTMTNTIPITGIVDARQNGSWSVTSVQSSPDNFLAGVHQRGDFLVGTTGTTAVTQSTSPWVTSINHTVPITGYVDARLTTGFNIIGQVGLTGTPQVNQGTSPWVTSINHTVPITGLVDVRQRDSLTVGITGAINFPQLKTSFTPQSIRFTGTGVTQLTSTTNVAILGINLIASELNAGPIFIGNGLTMTSGGTNAGWPLVPGASLTDIPFTNITGVFAITQHSGNILHWMVF